VEVPAASRWVSVLGEPSIIGLVGQCVIASIMDNDQSVGSVMERQLVSEEGRVLLSEDDRPTDERPAIPAFEGDRRKQDRRQADRQGKYDRRRNRCSHCIHFQMSSESDNASESGACQFHHITVLSHAFACPNFDPLSPPTEPRR
jgi:hypothetical protein